MHRRQERNGFHAIREEVIENGMAIMLTLSIGKMMVLRYGIIIVKMENLNQDHKIWISILGKE